MSRLGLNTQQIIVYTGPGSSNSWVWLADFLEGHGFLGARFVPDARDALDSIGRGVLIIPGGDALEIARSFGAEGFEKLARRIHQGAGYIGICAGAYLPLYSSIPPLSSFNLLDAKIANLSGSIPKGLRDEEKYSVRYGCSYVFHPARGPLGLSGDRELIAPLYGGPILIRSEAGTARLSFSKMLKETEILIDEGLCEEMMFGNTACLEGSYGKGRVLSIAPHLEHPDFPAANEYLAEILRSFEPGKKQEKGESRDSADPMELRRTVADLRVLAAGLEAHSWKVGIKYWEGEKLLFFIDAVRRRLDLLRRDNEIEKFAVSRDAQRAFDKAKASLLIFKDDVDDGPLSSEIVEQLSEGTSLFLNAYFEKKDPN